MDSYLIYLEWEIVVFLPRIFLLLSGELLERPDYAETCVARLDDIIDVSVACGIVRVRLPVRVR